MNINDPGRRAGCFGVQRPEKFGPNPDAILVEVGYIGNEHTAEVSLSQGCQQRCSDQEHQAKSKHQRRFAAAIQIEKLWCIHGRHPKKLQISLLTLLSTGQLFESLPKFICAKLRDSGIEGL